jgi:membrane-associated phospholipid phosphatase
MAHEARAMRRGERELLAAAGALAALALLALVLDDAPALRRLDRAARRLAASAAARGMDRIMAPLFPFGLPGVYIPIAHLSARWLAHRGARQTWRIPVTAWGAWLAHRGVKLVYERERPRGTDRAGARKPRRTDSYPSGHTTGVTALAQVLGAVMREVQQAGGRAGASATTHHMRTLVRATPFVMAAQRLVADDHWATDILGGLALGSAVARTCCACADVVEER